MPEPRELLAAITGGTFTEFTPDDPASPPDGPLGWPGYDDARARARTAGGESESVVCGRGRVGAGDAVLVAFDFRFLGGSVGGATGERVCRAIARARDAGLPLVSLLATGGSRMQEGMVSLHQLQRMSAELSRHAAAGLAQVSVLRDPTTGGVWASLGASADVSLAVAGAQIGFAGSRVRPAADLDDPAFTAAGQFAAGGVDAVVREENIPTGVTGWLDLLRAGDGEPAEVPNALGAADPADGWTAVRAARDPGRPRAAAYLADHFDGYRLLSGDRAGGVDAGTLCGVGRRGGRSVAFVAQSGTATTPAGYRTAVRTIRLAERLRLPVLTLIDTPGAANGAAAERAGQGPAIAAAFHAIAAARTPITTLVIGEGGSGGALALCAPGRTWIAPNAYFSVIAPELAAAILKRDTAEVPAIANRLRPRPADLVALGLAEGIAATAGDAP